jgi:hypothetical protein
MKNFRIMLICLLWWLTLAPWGYANQVDRKFSMSMIFTDLPNRINSPAAPRH